MPATSSSCASIPSGCSPRRGSSASSIPYTVEEIDAACQATVAKNGLTDAYVRPIAWRGSEMLAVAAQQHEDPPGHRHLGLADLFRRRPRMKGVRLGHAKWRRPAPDTAPTASKAAGLYMIGTLSKHAAEAEGFDDALMLDCKGDVAEATGANVFFVMDGELHTPTPVCFLDGITRRTVMGLARQHQIKVVERTIQPGGAEACHRSLPGRHRRRGDAGAGDRRHRYTPGDLTETLMRDYEALVRLSPAEVAKNGA